MARTGRRDCRKNLTKKNHINQRVEGLQKAIRKAKKEGTALPPHRQQGLPVSASSGAEQDTTKLTASANDFLSQMRSDAEKSITKLRDETAALSAASRMQTIFPAAQHER